MTDETSATPAVNPPENGIYLDPKWTDGKPPSPTPDTEAPFGRDGDGRAFAPHGLTVKEPHRPKRSPAGRGKARASIDDAIGAAAGGTPPETPPKTEKTPAEVKAEQQKVRDAMRERIGQVGCGLYDAGLQLLFSGIPDPVNRQTGQPDPFLRQLSATERPNVSLGCEILADAYAPNLPPWLCALLLFSTPIVLRASIYSDLKRQAKAGETVTTSPPMVEEAAKPPESKTAAREAEVAAKAAAPPAMKATPAKGRKSRGTK